MTKFIPLFAIGLLASCSGAPSETQAVAASTEAIAGEAAYVVTSKTSRAANR